MAYIPGRLAFLLHKFNSSFILPGRRDYCLWKVCPALRVTVRYCGLEDQEHAGCILIKPFHLL